MMKLTDEQLKLFLGLCPYSANTNQDDTRREEPDDQEDFEEDLED